MQPPAGQWLFFVAIDKQGHSAFANTHERAPQATRPCTEERCAVTDVRRAAVCGKPIGHSLSPVIHNAGYAAAGLPNWTYTAIECAEAELAGLVAGLGPEWAGLVADHAAQGGRARVADDVVAGRRGGRRGQHPGTPAGRRPGSPTTPTPPAWCGCSATAGVGRAPTSRCSAPAARPGRPWPRPPSLARRR